MHWGEHLGTTLQVRAETEGDGTEGLGRLRHPLALAGGLVAGCGLFLALVSVEAYGFSPDFRTYKGIPFPLGRGFTPYYRYVRHVTPIALVAVVVLTTVVLAVAWVSPRLITRFEHVTVALWLIGGVFLQLIVRNLAPGLYSLRTDVVYDDFNQVARTQSPTELLQHYVAIAKFLHFNVHLGANMPGKAAFYSLLRGVVTSARDLSVALVVVSSIGAVLVYYIARYLFRNRVTAIYAMILYVVLPSRVVFLPFLNTITPVFLLALMALLVAWFETRVWALLFGFGVMLYLAVLFEPAPLVAAPVFLALIVREVMASRLSIRDLVALLLVPVGFFIADAFMLIALRFDIIKAITLVSKDSGHFNSSSKRGQVEFLVSNLREFFVQAGVALSLVTLWTIVRDLVAVASAQGTQRARRTVPSASATLGGALVAVLIILETAGVNRGETARLWIFLACFFPFVVADVCTRGPRWLYSVVLACTLTQAIVVTNVFATSYPTFYHYTATRAPTWDGAFLVDIYIVGFVVVVAIAGLATLLVRPALALGLIEVKPRPDQQ